jgi:hypothetical protein
VINNESGIKKATQSAHKIIPICRLVGDSPWVSWTLLQQVKLDLIAHEKEFI